MIKRVMAGFLGGLMFLALPSSARALAVEPANDQTFDLPCQAAILVDEDSGTVLYEKNADEQRPIASITKVMTLLLTFEVMEAGKISREDTVPVSEHAYSMGGSQIWLEPGEEMTLDDMLKAICISSANDAAVAVAEYVGGSEGAFVSMMNEKAAALGMDRTHFENACGLDSEGHLSTARDVATMSREVLLHHPEVEDYCMIWSDSLRGGETQLVNTNKLLRRYTGITGLKTGTTGKAGVCISASAERDGLRLVAVVLGAASSEDRFDAATALLDYGFAHYESAAAPMPKQAPSTLPVQHGTEPTVTLQYTVPDSFLVAKGGGAALQAELSLPEQLEAPVRQGQTVGTMTIRSGQQGIASCPIVAETEVPARSFGFCFRRLVESLLPERENFVQNGWGNALSA